MSDPSGLAALRLTVCGAGAIGSNLLIALLRMGLRHATVIDFDRVEPHNVANQHYGLSDAGAPKVEVLQAEAYRIAEVEIATHHRKIDERTVARLLRGSTLVVDALDNHAGRAVVAAHCAAAALPCLHIGLAAGYAEVLWNEGYRVPRDPDAADPCPDPVAAPLVAVAVAVAAETILRYAARGARPGWTFTLDDLAIRPLP